MRTLKIPGLPLSVIILLLSACSNPGNKTAEEAFRYKPDDQSLYDTIVHLDSVFFNLYNTCDVHLDQYASFYSDSIEFYHDKGGLSTSKQDLVEGTKKNVCGKVTRELVKGSIEVYPIKDFGAVEMGLHKFHNKQEKETTPPQAARFVIIWQHKNNEWKIARVISLH